jgi:hypothetical protein
MNTQKDKIVSNKKKTTIDTMQQRMYNWFADYFSAGQDGINRRRTLMRTAITSAVVLFSCITVLNIILSPGTAEYNIQKYFFLYAIPIFIIFAIMLNLGQEPETTKLFLKICGLLILAAIGVYYYATQTSSLFNLSILSNYFAIAAIVLVGLAIVYQSLIEYMEKLKGWPGFIAQLVFYIPCIIWDLWEYIVSEFNLTPYSIYLFIAFEILLIIVYAYLPDISNSVTGMNNAIQAVDNVIYLDGGKRIVVNSDELKIPKDSQNDPIKSLHGDYLTNYAVSMWVYINPQGPTDPAYNKETEIFSYGFTDEHGVQHVKPMIRYYGGGGGDDQQIERNKFVFYFSRYPPIQQYASDAHTFYDVTLPNQKWNQIVLNYNRNIVDLFINGVLERTFTMNGDMPIYNDLDTITVGDDSGLKGGICNVVYYKHPLSKEQIVTSYNTKMNSNPPVSSPIVDSE